MFCFISLLDYIICFKLKYPSLRGRSSEHWNQIGSKAWRDSKSGQSKEVKVIQETASGMESNQKTGDKIKLEMYFKD